MTQHPTEKVREIQENALLHSVSPVLLGMRAPAILGMNGNFGGEYKANEDCMIKASEDARAEGITGSSLISFSNPADLSINTRPGLSHRLYFGDLWILISSDVNKR